VTFEVGGIVWSDQTSGGRDYNPYLIVTVDRNMLHLMDLSKGNVFEMQKHQLCALLDHRDDSLYYEGP
jgi:hypothetical protein